MKIVLVLLLLMSAACSNNGGTTNGDASLGAPSIFSKWALPPEGQTIDFTAGSFGQSFVFESVYPGAGGSTCQATVTITPTTIVISGMTYLTGGTDTVCEYLNGSYTYYIENNELGLCPSTGGCGVFLETK